MAPTDTAVAPMYFKKFLLEILSDMSIPSFLSDGEFHQGKVKNLFISPPLFENIFHFRT
jgi:hypothetical protein